jgi:argininosuccinate lyase
MVPRIRFNKKRMSDTASAAYATATDVAEYLVRKGLPFRDAHETTGRIVLHCIEDTKTLNDLTITELKRFSPLIEGDVYKYLRAEDSVRAKTSRGGTSPSQVKKQLKRLRGLLNS